jgi:hypothetical protein
MSDAPDDNPERTQHGDDDQHGGQAPGGQPQGAPAQGGQGQGYQQGPPQGGYQTGPGVGDILNIPETKTEMKVGILLNVLLSVGFAFAALGVSTISTGFGTGLGSLGGVTGGAMAITPLVGVLLGLRQSDVLDDQPLSLVYANAGVTTAVGTFVLLLLTMILGLIIAGASGQLGNVLGQMLLPYIITVVGAGLVAAGAVWTDRNVLPGPSRVAAQSQQSQAR